MSTPTLAADDFGYIMDAHGFDTTQPPDGQFSPNLDTEEDLMNLVRLATSAGTVRPSADEQMGYEHDSEFEREIGEAGDIGARRPTRKIHVIVGDRAVRAAHPTL